MIRIRHANLNSMWDEIDLRTNDEIKKKMKDWGQEYMKRIIEDLIELKIKAKKENNPALYDQLRTSLIRAHEVQNGLK